MVTITTRIPKIGKPEGYIGLPVTDRMLQGPTSADKEKVVGSVIDVVEDDNEYVLSVDVHDESIIKKVQSYSTVSYSIERTIASDQN